MKCPYCHKIIKMPYRKVKAFTDRQEYILTEDFKDCFIGLIKKGTILIFRGYNLGYARFYIKDDKKFRHIAIDCKEAFEICRKEIK